VRVPLLVVLLLGTWASARGGPRLTDLTALDSNVVQRVAPWRGKPLNVPRESANWIFYYACPKDNARLTPAPQPRQAPAGDGGPQPVEPAVPRRSSGSASGAVPSLTAGFEAPGHGFLRAWFVGDEATDWFSGLGIGTSLPERVPFLLRRRRAASAVFVTVYDLSGDGSAVSGVTLLHATPDSVELRLTAPTGPRRFALDLRPTAVNR
jgi:hypothetical protein